MHHRFAPPARIDDAVQRSSLLVKTLFHTGARVSEFAHIQVPDLFLIQLVVREAATQARIDKQVTPPRLRASVATMLLGAGMPLDHVQKFLRHQRSAGTRIYAETSLRGLGETVRQSI